MGYFDERRKLIPPLMFIGILGFLIWYLLIEFVLKKDTLSTGYLYGINDTCFENPILIQHLRFESDRNELLRCYKNGYMKCDSLAIPEHHLLKKKADDIFEIVGYYLDSTLIEVRFRNVKNEIYGYVPSSILRESPPSNDLVNCNN